MYSLKKNRSLKKVFFVSLLTLIMLGLAGTGLYVRKTYYDNLLPLSADATVTVVTINSGSSVHEVGLLLVQKNLISKSWPFEWYVRSHNVRDKLQAGSYAFMPSMSIAEIVKKILSCMKKSTM